MTLGTIFGGPQFPYASKIDKLEYSSMNITLLCLFIYCEYLQSMYSDSFSFFVYLVKQTILMVPFSFLRRLSIF